MGENPGEDRVTERKRTESNDSIAPGGSEHAHRTIRGKRPGDRYVRVLRSSEIPISQQSGYYRVTEPTAPTTPLGRLYRRLRRVLIGYPLQTSQAIHERLSKKKALAVFSSDNISSTAYATEEALLILILAGPMATEYLVPIGLAIAALLLIVGFSYRQTIQAYPHGGGAYIVTKDNLGKVPALLAGSALLTDYILTVAVSISAGVAAITSAFPNLRQEQVMLAVGAIALITIANLRGVRESGNIFALPTYLFIGGMAILLSLGFLAWLGFGVNPSPPERPPLEVAQPLTLFLILRAFASGCAALTGIEAISDGVPAFEAPEAKNAAKTLTVMILILGSIFLGITFLADHFELVPSEEETLVSQLARTLVGESPFYYYIQAATAGILFLAANTSFADFPRVASFLARDRFMPHQFLYRGDRLAFSTGIVVLALAASLLVIAFGASVTQLIPLYAVGVFISFTLSQGSMAYRWWRQIGLGARRLTGMVISGTGAVTTFVVALIIVTTKFTGGAWLVLLILPSIIAIFLGIRRHYDRVADQLRMTTDEIRHRPMTWTRDTAVVVPIDTLNQASIRAIDYAQGISHDVTVVHVTDDMEEAEQLRGRWAEAGMHLPLVIIESPFRELVGPLVNYIEQLHREKGSPTLTVVLPEFVPAHLYELGLHNQTAWRLRTALWTHPSIVVTSVPYHLAR